jgi:hypothetical protein
MRNAILSILSSAPVIAACAIAVALSACNGL